MTETTCTVAVCDRPAADGYVCRGCIGILQQTLAEIPWLVDELDLVISRQTRYTSGGGRTSGSTEVPLPVDLRASDVLADLAYRLASWSLMLVEENPHWTMPSQHPTSTSRWLLCRLETIRCHGAGADLVEEISQAAATGWHVIDRPAERQFLGRCQDQNHAPEATGADLRAWQPETEPTCPGSVYGSTGALTARCDMCGAEWEAEALRAYLIASLDDKLCSAAEIARLSTYLGLTIGRDQVRKQINQWHSRGRLPRMHTSAVDGPLFRFGTAMILLEKHNAQRVGA